MVWVRSPERTDSLARSRSTIHNTGDVRMNLADWFPDEDHRFYMRFDRGTMAEYFRPADAKAEVLAERCHWLRTNPHSYYMDIRPEGVPLLEETIALADRENALSSQTRTALSIPASPQDRCRLLGEGWEPDYVLLNQGTDGLFRVCAGCVCFPSSWDLSEKMGHPMEFVHAPVPGLNSVLGKQITAFLDKMKPGLTWERVNWSLSRSADLNLHPKRGLPRLDSATPPAEIHLRIEHQALVKLPASQGVLFGIRILDFPMPKVKEDAIISKRLARALATMEERVAVYKGLASSRESVVRYLVSDELAGTDCSMADPKKAPFHRLAGKNKPPLA
jgi:hypothetical protein